MAIAKKLPSGSYRCLAFVGMENGKKRYKSFTAPTKKEAEFLASQYLLEKNENVKSINKRLFKDEIDNYISSKDGVLSPSTIAGYENIKRRLKDNCEFYDFKVCDITQEDIQKYISKVSKDKSPKTVRNYHGLISAVLSDMNLNTRMPQKKEPDIYIPTDNDIKSIIQCAEKTDVEMVIPIMLGGYCMMRRGEICGLEYNKDIDIKTNTIHIHHSLVIGTDNKWHLKAPKTNSSDRYIKVPDFVIKLISERGYISNYNPNQITQHLRFIQDRCNVQHFNFHLLRHFAASTYHSLNIPDAYIMEYGGWKSDNVLKTIYRHALKDKKDDIQLKAIQHFETIQHEIQHEN